MLSIDCSAELVHTPIRCTQEDTNTEIIVVPLPRSRGIKRTRADSISEAPTISLLHLLRSDQQDQDCEMSFESSPTAHAMQGEVDEWAPIRPIEANSTDDSEDPPRPFKIARMQRQLEGNDHASGTRTPDSIPSLSPHRPARQDSREVATLSPLSCQATLSNPSSSPSTPPLTPQQRVRMDEGEVIQLDGSPSTSSVGAPQNTPSSSSELPTLILPFSASNSTSSTTSTSSGGASSSTSSSPGGVTALGMRGRWLKSLQSTPHFQLCVPDEVQQAGESKLGSLIIPLHPAGVSGGGITPKRSPMVGSRSLTPPPNHSPCGGLLQPFSFSRAMDSSLDGIHSSGSWYGLAGFQGSRQNMQDSGTCQPLLGTFVLADGHGRTGHIVAALITSLLPGILKDAKREIQQDPSNSEEGLMDSAIKQAFASMESHLLRHTSQGGSTCTLVHVTEEAATKQRVLYLAHLGDTRAVLCPADGNAVVLTHDHKPEDPVERSAILSRGGTVTQRSRLKVDIRAPSTPVALPHHHRDSSLNGSNKHSIGVSPAHTTATHFQPFSHAFDKLPSAAIVAASPTHANGSTSTANPSTPLAQSNAQWRVEGLLNLSRSFGDAHLKQYITAVPTVGRFVLPATSLSSSPAHQPFLIVATDGLWNVVPNQEACELTREFFANSNETEGKMAEDTQPPMSAHHEKRRTGSHPIHSLAARAAEYLANIAIQRGTTDNVSVIILQL